MLLATQMAPGNAQQLGIGELEEISELLDANDVEGLRGYLSLRPELLEGDSELSELLARYMAVTSDAIGFLGVGGRQSDDDADLSRALRDAIDDSAGDDQGFVPAASDAAAADDTIY
jgi:hypothetical protein